MAATVSVGELAEGIRIVRGDRLGEAKVEDLDLPFGADGNVGRLEVAVDDPLLMRRLQRLGHLARNPERLTDWQPMAGKPYAFGERPTLHQFHYQELAAAPSSRP